ncbi:MAG: hypothetical protein V8R46_07015 [Eubacterium ramulus]
MILQQNLQKKQQKRKPKKQQLLERKSSAAERKPAKQKGRSSIFLRTLAENGILGIMILAEGEIISGCGMWVEILTEEQYGIKRDHFRNRKKFSFIDRFCLCDERRIPW